MFGVRRLFIAVWVLLGLAVAQAGTINLEPILEQVRAKHNLPSLAAVAVLGTEVVGQAAVGVRRFGSPERVTLGDVYALGSISKSINATMLAKLVEQGVLRWDSTVGEVFAGTPMREEYKKVTLIQLLSNMSGISGNTFPAGTNWLSLEAASPQLRQKYLEAVLARPPEAPPGSKYIYSNAGYAVAAIMGERVTGKNWETLVRETVFQPLGMNSCSFGTLWRTDAVENPWPHGWKGGVPQAFPPDGRAGNSRVIDGADQARCSMPDFAKYVIAHVQGERGVSGVLNAETFKWLHRNHSGSGYGLGWNVLQRPWAGGQVLNHAGSNTFNFAVMWLAPRRNLAVVVATNIARDLDSGTLDGTTRMVDEAVGAILQELLKLAPAAN